MSKDMIRIFSLMFMIILLKKSVFIGLKDQTSR
jgi:hypothetical protein